MPRGVYIKSDNHKKKLSESLSGKSKSDTAKQNMRKPKSEDHKKKMSKVFKNTINSIWLKINIKSSDECWEYIGLLDKDGYGSFMINYKNMRAHRVAYESFYGSIPKKLLVLHKCDNPSCCNPNHLWLGTNKDNTQDMINKGRGIMCKNKRTD